MIRFATHCFIIVSTLLTINSFGQPFLQTNKPVKSNIAPNKTDSFYVALQKGQTATIRLSQQQVSLLAIINDPLDSLQLVVDQSGIGHDEIISIDAAMTGNYKVFIRWNFSKPLEGPYTITLTSVAKNPASTIAKANRLFDQWYKEQAPGAVLLVIKDGKVLVNKAKGMANLEEHVPLTNASLFDIASVSKQFTAFAIAMLIDQGKLSLNDDIKNYLPEFPSYKEGPITIRDLVYHTSGIRDWIDAIQLSGITPADAFDHASVMRFTMQQKQLLFAPGTKFRYTNTNYNLLAEIITRTTGQLFSAWVTTHILQPLGMHASFFKDDAAMVYDHQVRSYQPGGEGYRHRLLNTAAPGSSSFQTSSDDMQKWILSFTTRQLITPGIDSLLAKTGVLKDGQSIGYAFGNNLGTYRGFRKIEHLGLHQGYRSSLVRFPTEGLSVFYVSNDDNDATYGRATAIADLFLGLAPEKPRRGLPSVDRVLADITRRDTTTMGPDAEQYAGIYVSDELFSTLKLVVKNKRLYITHPRMNDIQLFRSNGDNFGIAVFGRSTDGRVNGMQIRGQEVLFRKQE